MNYTLVLLYSGILHKIMPVYSMSKIFTYMFINFYPLAFELLKHFETLGLGVWVFLSCSQHQVTHFSDAMQLRNLGGKKRNIAATFSLTLKGCWVLLPLILNSTGCRRTECHLAIRDFCFPDHCEVASLTQANYHASLCCVHGTLEALFHW